MTWVGEVLHTGNAPEGIKGEKNLNILTLGIVYQGAAIPAYCPVRSLFADLAVGKSRSLRKRRRIGQQWVWLSGVKLDSGELLILAGNQRFSQPLEIYGLRWEIEHLFQCLKGRGFHLEETRLTRYFRIKKVMALLALAFCWAHKTGEWKHQAVKPLKTKKHGRPEQSLFRYGLDYLTNSLLQGYQAIEERLRHGCCFYARRKWSWSVGRIQKSWLLKYEGEPGF